MKKTGIKRVILILSFVFALSVVNTAQAQSIRNSSGGYMGKVENDGTVRNSSGGYAGKIENDGTVRNSSGGYMGKVENDGTVRNSSGGYMGKAEYLSRKQAAAVFFFFHF